MFLDILARFYNHLPGWQGIIGWHRSSSYKYTSLV